MDIRLAGDRTVVIVNGIKVTDYKEGEPVPPKAHSYEPDRGSRPREGYMGIQNHDPGSVVFRDILVRRLQNERP